MLRSLGCSHSFQAPLQRRQYCSSSKPPTPEEAAAAAAAAADAAAPGAQNPDNKKEAGSDLAAQENKPGSMTYDPEPFVKGLTKVKWMPLTLIQEIPKPVRTLSDIEILMTAWSEEQAKYFFVFTWAIRGVILCIVLFGIWFGSRVNKSLNHVLRGTDNMPSGLRIGNVVYLDMEIAGSAAGRITIGLFNEDCPLYCEYFHRMCTGSGGNGASFRGLPYVCNQNISMSFGYGSDMTHDVPGFNALWLPTEKESNGPWRGALSSMCYTREKQSPNFQIHLHGSKDTPQIFGMVLSGFETLEKINRLPTVGGAGAPQMDVVVGACGELCTLDKSLLTPLPWSLYQGVSAGYDSAKYGPSAPYPASMMAMD